MKNRMLILAIILQSVQVVFGQVPNRQVQNVSKEHLIGVWQFSTPKIGAGLLENFKFFKDGSFVYTFNPVDENRKFVSIKGTFRVDKSELYLKVISLKEVVGGDVVSGAVGTDIDLFVVDGSTVKERRIERPKELDALFMTANDTKGKNLMINNKKFFKLTSDPNKSF